MRRFVVIGHDVPLDADFSLDDLPGSAGRLDILCRCVTAGLCLSHGMRADVEVLLVLKDSLTIRIDSNRVRNLHPDERSTAALIRTAIENRDRAIGHQEVESSPGIFVTNRGLQAMVAECAETSPIFILDEGGTPISEHTVTESATFFLADHRGFSSTDRSQLQNTSAGTIRVGPRSLHADHTITIVHNWLDTNGYTSY